MKRADRPVEDYEDTDEGRDPRYPPGATTILFIPLSLIGWALALWAFPLVAITALLFIALIVGIIALTTEF